MIVRPHGSTRLLITQPDHAALSARMMQHWQAGRFPANPRRPAILVGIEEHDNGWRELDAAPLVDEGSGRILDFIEAPAEIRRPVWPRAVQRLAETPYAAALVAQHALHIYRRYRDEPDWAALFRDLEAERDRQRRATSAPLDDLLRDYFFVRIGDLLSLTFCNGWTDPQTDDAGSGYGIRLDGTRLLVTPDPFGGVQLPIAISGREIPDRRFHSAAEARAIFEAAPVVTVSGLVVGEPH